MYTYFTCNKEYFKKTKDVVGMTLPTAKKERNMVGINTEAGGRHPILVCNFIFCFEVSQKIQIPILFPLLNEVKREHLEPSLRMEHFQLMWGV